MTKKQDSNPDNPTADETFALQEQAREERKQREQEEIDEAARLGK